MFIAKAHNLRYNGISNRKGCVHMKICVYGAASAAIDRQYSEAAERLGELIADRGHSLVFGAGASGMMGGVARGVFRRGGELTGVVPTFFNVDGILFDSCTRLIRTETMRERKQVMEDSSDAFIVTPGGIGTFEEFFEILTLKQLGRHEKPIVILNTNSYYDSMLEMLKLSVKGGFLTEGCIKLFYVTADEADALSYIEHYKPQKYSILDVRSIRVN